MTYIMVSVRHLSAGTYGGDPANVATGVATRQVASGSPETTVAASPLLAATCFYEGDGTRTRNHRIDRKKKVHFTNRWPHSHFDLFSRFFKGFWQALSSPACPDLPLEPG
jgi:hypothetical protein